MNAPATWLELSINLRLTQPEFLWGDHIWIICDTVHLHCITYQAGASRLTFRLPSLDHGASLQHMSGASVRMCKLSVC